MSAQETNTSQPTATCVIPSATERAANLIIYDEASDVDDDNMQDLLERRISEEIELMLDPLEFEKRFEPPISFDLLAEGGNLPDDVGQSSDFCASSHS